MGSRDYYTFFYPPSRPTTWVARRCGEGGARALVGSMLPVRAAWMAYHRRRAPRRFLEARRRAREGGESEAWIGGDEHSFRGAVVVSVAPGERQALEELVDSVRRYEGDSVKVVVADDLTGEYPDAVAARDFPGVDFVRPKFPGAGSQSSFRVQQVGFLHVAATYDVPAVLKLDPDALIVNSGAFDRAAERFAEDEALGELGTTTVDASGRDTSGDGSWVPWAAHSEIRWNRSFRRLVDAAERRTPQIRLAKGGSYFLAKRTIVSAAEQGLMPFRQSSISLLSEDVITGLLVQAAGFRVGSFGGPGDPIACDTNSLPLEVEELIDQGHAVVHSVRGSPAGMTEPQIRSLLRARREGVS